MFDCTRVCTSCPARCMSLMSFLLYIFWPDDYLISSVNDFGDSGDDFSVTWFVIKNPNMIAPTKRPNISIGPSHSNRVFNECRVEGSFDDINGFICVYSVQTKDLRLIFVKHDRDVSYFCLRGERSALVTEEVSFFIFEWDNNTRTILSQGIECLLLFVCPLFKFGTVVEVIKVFDTTLLKINSCWVRII